MAIESNMERREKPAGCIAEYWRSKRTYGVSREQLGYECRELVGPFCPRHASSIHTRTLAELHPLNATNSSETSVGRRARAIDLRTRRLRL